jgi:hypothetical protein
VVILAEEVYETQTLAGYRIEPFENWNPHFFVFAFVSCSMLTAYRRGYIALAAI